MYIYIYKYRNICITIYRCLFNYVYVCMYVCIYIFIYIHIHLIHFSEKCMLHKK